MRTAWTSNSGQSIVRVMPSSSRTIGRVDWKSTNSSGSICANASAPRLPAMKVSAEVADSPASFQPLKAQTSAGARRPSGRRSQRSGCIAIHGTASAASATMDDDVLARAHVAGLRAGDTVDAVFACSRKDRLTARSGTPYLALELRDRTGAIQARAFRDADVLAGRFERGDLVRVAGRVERFRDELQIEVRGDRPAEQADPAAFLPVAYRDVDELDGFLEHLAREVHDAGVRGPAASGCSTTTRCAPSGGARPARAAATTPTSAGCSSTRSRSARWRSNARQLHPRLNPDLLLTAALVHDLGKTREFTYGAEIGLTDEGRLLGHVVLGQRMLDRYELPDDRRLALAHCVLTHHGPQKRARRPVRLAPRRSRCTA